MNETLQTLTTRRSIRRYSDIQIPDNILKQILHAASFSPNAGNRQTTQIVVCQNARLNEELGRLNKSFFHGRISTEMNFVSKDQPSIADDPSLPSAFYGAPTVITLFGPANFLYCEADCWIMASNIALAAHSLGIGSCLLGRAEDTFSIEPGITLQKEWNIPAGFEAKVHILLGYPKGEYPHSKPRTYPKPVIIR